MKPAPFEYLRAGSVTECLEILGERGADAKVLSGGQSLVPLMNLRLARPEVVVDINRLADLSFVRRDSGTLEVGALTRHNELAESAAVQQACPLVASAASKIGYPAIRNRGTLGGSVAHADPAAELPCACLALGAEIVVSGPEGPRRVPAADFFLSHFTTALAPTEMVTGVRFPVIGPGEGWAFEEFARKTGDFALVAVGVVVRLAATSVEHVSIAVAGVGGRPMRMAAVESSLEGEVLSDDVITTAGAGVTAEVAGPVPTEEEGFRPHLAGVLAARALRAARRRAAGEEVPVGQ